MQRRAYSWIADSFKRFTLRIPSFSRPRMPVNDSSRSTSGGNSQPASKASPTISPWNVLQLAAIRRQQSRYGQPFWLTLPLHRCSPRKLGEVAKLIAGIKLEEAIRQVRFCPKRPAIRVYDLLCQARATIRQQVYPPFIDREGGSGQVRRRGDDGEQRRQLDSVTPEMHAKANALVARYSILQAVTGKGPFLKRIEFKARGRTGIRKRPHAMLRVQFGIVDETKRVERLLRQTVVIQENKPVYCRLDY